MPMLMLQENMRKSLLQRAAEGLSTGLDLSITRVGSPRSEGFVCGECDRTYKLKSSLRNHQKWECGKEPQFQCVYCPYKAKQKMHMNRHMERMHRDIDYSCAKNDKSQVGDEDSKDPIDEDYSSLLKSVTMEMTVDEDS